jgi:sugar phosphate isomerase/epimerase
MSQQITRRHFAAIAAVSASQLFAAPAKPKVGCQMNAYPLKQGDFPGLLAALDKIKPLGFEGFECNVRFMRGQFGRAEAARREIERSGIRFVGAHTSMEEAATGFAETVAGAAALGVETMVVSSKGLSPDGMFSPDALREKASAMERLAKVCRDHGIRFSYHNHNPEFANGNAEIDGLAKATSPELVSFLMDAGHAHLGGGDPAKFLAAHSSRVFGMHLKTFIGKDMHDQKPLGKGDFDFEDVAAVVKKTGWSGWLIDEEGGGPIPGNYAALPSDREHIRRLFGV